MKWLLVLALAAAAHTVPAISERTLFEALGARGLPARGWLSVPEARARSQEEAARLKLARASGRGDPAAEGTLSRLNALIERRAAATGLAPPVAPVDEKTPRPLFGSQSVRVLVCKYRGGLDPNYHRPGCSHLRGIVSPMELAEARRTCAPCPSCRAARP